MNGVIQATQDQEVTLTSNTSSVPFNIVDLRTASAVNCRSWMNHNEGSALFSIISGGVYEITFNANVTSATAGSVALALFADGVQVAGTEMDEVIATAGDFANNSVLSVVYSGGATPVVTDTQIPIIKNANINIERLS